MKRVLSFLLLATVVLCFVTTNLLAMEKGTLVFIQGAEITSTDPALHHSITDTNYCYAIFDQLYFRDNDGTPKPSLAVSHKLIDDNTWEFELRKGVRFHNNDPFTAKDVKFTIDRILNPETKFRFGIYYRTIKSVDVVNDYTVRITTHKPDPLMLKRLSMYSWIMPSRYIEEKGMEEFKKNPVGTGPFKFVEWIQNDRFVFEANKDYWEGAPGIEKLIIRPVPEIGTALAELESGGSDLITNIPPFLVNRLKGKKGITVETIPSGRIICMYINALSPGPLQDKRVRQALNYAIDRQAIIDKILMGSAKLIPINLTSYHFGYNPELEPYPYDPEKAKQLLKEAGYPNLALRIDSPSGRYVLDKQVAEAIAGMFSEVGIQTNFQTHEWGSYTKMLVGKKLEGVGFIGWGNMFHDADGSHTPWFTNPKVPFCYYTDDFLVGELEKARHSMDPAERLAIYKRVGKHLKEEAALVFLYQQVDHYGVSDRVKGWKARGDEIVDFRGVSVD